MSVETHTPPVAETSFRDRISTVDEQGKRLWIFPKMPKGKFTQYRQLVGYTLLLFFFVAPFIRIGDEPLILLNVPHRHFVLFGVVFWPQDFHLFLLAMLAFVVFVVLFTVIYGRVFCGWACPQTIFMELVFRRIEYWIDGDRNQQIKLSQAPMNVNKAFKRILKHAIFFTISFIISNLFLTYIMGTDAWWKLITDNPLNHLPGLIAMLVFTAVFYGVYARFREQVCTTVCPYGRLQGVMLDKNSVVVAYDYMRGEPRHHLEKKNENTDTHGDCIDCHLCVHVCPTGIDIRNGVQMECVNCTACIDACDEVMEKVHRPKGLIRYASENTIANKVPFRFTSRMIGYSAVLVVLLVSLSVLLITRPEVQTSVLRTPGMLYQETEDGRYSNLYNLKVINKTHKQLQLRYVLQDAEGEIRMVGHAPDVLPKAIAEGAFFIVLDESQLKGMKTNLHIGVYDGDKLVETVRTTFVGPAL